MDSLPDLIARLDGPGYRGEADYRQAVVELHRFGPDALREALAPLLSADDPEMRCGAALAAVLAGIPDAQSFVLPLLEDASSTVRWYVCGLLHDRGDERAIEPLVRRLTSDVEPQVRVIAAYALGGIGSPAAVPALEEAAARDHEVDPLGYTPSGAARDALSEIAAAVAVRRGD